MARFLRFFPLLLLCVSVSAQKINDKYQLQIQKATGPIKIDGVGDDAAWGKTDVAKDFFMILPMDTSLANVKTEVRMTYDDKAIYMLAICYKAFPDDYVVESLRRDFNFGKNDNFIFCLDPFNDRTNGFSFGANAAGAQWDGFIYEGGKMDLSWENKWVSEVKNYPDKWVFEAAIPFKSIRFKKGITKWGINFSRNDLKTFEKSAWAPVPRQFPSVSLAYTGDLVWDQAPPETGSNISIIPYALGGASRDYENKTPTEYRTEIGGDAKISVTSAMNLDLTVNPDFSQVEVDRQVTNLERYELFFPERRQFFLENSDIFGSFGYADIRPFFSRRIGLNVPIQYGARLSGRINKDWRMGVMDMQTKSVSESDMPAQNFAVVSLQRKVQSRSSIGVLFVNKQSLNYTPDKDSLTPVASDYNRNLGFEYNLASPGNYWTGKAMVLKSFSPGTTSDTYTHAANLNYTSRHWALGAQYQFVGKNFNAEVGYVPRTGYLKLNPVINYLFFAPTGKILSHGPIFSATNYYDESFKPTDYETLLGYRISFRNQSTLTGVLAKDYVKLLKPYDPTNSGMDSLPAGSEHWWNSASLEYISRQKSLFTFSAFVRYGGYYANGERLQVTNELSYRFQPYVIIALSTSYNNISLPQPWGIKSYWLVGPRLDVTFTNKLYFTAFSQYNEQTHNINLNTRLQWRYKPASDFYIVYTDNYLPENFSVRNRALVLKFTYWFSL
ncbi:DUF5916 domain-containing protein [Flavihumibacter profundi]|uniref:DUF5916 domain-containing protein n=1 Tax=Flavihumibacter profundi TaxID=2716883 RepID=UPI001CC75D41|nr:DUF5916 domain-containing protein [Flavihumibacter profundi]MBZ5856454.1 carbohydrate binding family 9 domain-containing protein [Flavihumibacter profundi]